MKFRNHISKLIISCTALLALGMTSCQDDELLYDRPTSSTLSRTVGEGTNTGGLVQKSDGTWIATSRVPLVGYGRLLNNMANSAVSVGAIGVESDNLTDLDITNHYSPTYAVIGADVVYGQVASVKDINHVYAPGQVAGFVVKTPSSGVLNLNLLQQMELVTSYRGVEQERKTVTTSSNLLGLGLGNVSVGQENMLVTLEAEFTKQFDEIRLDKGGVNADVIKDGLEVYYAFVGETEREPVITSTFPNCSTDTSDPLREKKLIDSDLKNGPGFGLIAAGRWRVNFGEIVEAGSEVGFYITSGSLLKLGVGSTWILRTFDEEGKLMDEMSSTDIVKLGLASGEDVFYGMLASGRCSGVEFAFGGVNVDLGGGTVHYAYVRKPVKVDSSSLYSATDVTIYNPNYRFPPAMEGKVSYELVSYPVGANPKIEVKNGETVLTGMSVTGPYVVMAKFTGPDGVEVTQKFTVTRGLNAQMLCENTALINVDGQEPRFRAYKPDGFPGITVLGVSGTEGSMNNIVDENTTNCVKFQKNLQVTLAANTPFVAVETIDHSSIKGSIKNARVGFVVDNNSTFLKADVLKFFRIVLKKNGQVISTELAKGAVTVGLIKNNYQNQTLTRLSVNTDKDFDCMELQAIEPITANIATEFSVFYAFCEDQQLECSNPGDDCMQLITNANYGAVPSWKLSGLASVAANVTNLGNIVDSDINSYGTIVLPVNAGTKSELSIKFNEIKASADAPQTVGFIIKNDVDLINLIGVTQLFAYNSDGIEVAKIEKFGVLDVELTNDKTYFPITVEQPFSELRLITGDGVNVGDGLNVCGIFIKPDLDGDGVLDCVGDNVVSGVYDFKALSSDICIGDLPEFSIVGAQPDYPFFIRFFEVNSGDNPVFSYKVKAAGDDITKSHTLIAWDDAEAEALKEFCASTASAGQYSVRFYSSESGTEEDALYMEIHPKQTAWKGSASSDWTDWDNWDNGEPWDCTDVVIPSQAHLGGTAKYPVLKKDGDYYCQNIHFGAGATLTGQNYLKYSGNVFVDYTFESDDYMLMSAPLKGMVTGDMFVPGNGWELNSGWNADKWSSYENYFEPLTAENYIEQRTAPIIYQRFWDEKVTNVTMSRAASNLILNADFNNWSRSFNAVSTGYELGQGFAVKVRDNKSKVTMHFPKSHTVYHYYDAAGNKLNKTESIARGTNAGHLWTDGVKDMSKMTVPLKRMTSGTVFLFGNPFMTKINVGALKNANSSVISIQKYVPDNGGQYVEMDDTESIKPMQAVFLIIEAPATEMKVAFSADVFPNA